MTISISLLPAVLVATTLAPAPAAADDLGDDGMWAPASQVHIDGVPSSQMTGMIWMTPGVPAVPGECDDVSRA